MKRKSTIAVIAAVLCMIMAVAMILPMSVSAADEPILGFTFADQYYQSEWKGSTLSNKQPWGGQWVKSDGQYNGCIQWTNYHDKITFDPENGVLTVNGAGTDLWMLYYPGQLATNGLAEGPAYSSMEVFYDSKAGNFSGLALAMRNGGTIFSADSATGKVTATSGQKGATKVDVGQLGDGWNNIEWVVLALDKDGNVLQDAGGLKQSEAGDAWPVASVDVYVRVSNEKDPAPEARAFTMNDLKGEDWTKIENYNCGLKFYKDHGGSTRFAPLKTTGEFKIRNGKAVLLGVDQEIFQYSYTNGDGKVINQAVPASASNQELTVPAGVKADGTPVKNWYNEAANKFLKPGDKVTVTESMSFIVATGEVEAIGLLGAAIDRVRDDLASYTYVELQAELDNLEAAATAANLDASHEYMQRKETKVSDIRARMNAVKDACLEVIDRVAILSDDSQALADRATAYEECQAYLSDLDATYSDATADAIDKLNSFETKWADAEPKFKEYTALLLQIDLADEGPDRNVIYLDIFMSFDQVAQTFATFELDANVVAGFEENLVVCQTQFNELTTVTEMYDFLVAWAETWNAFCKAQYMGRADALPAALAESVQKYNDTVKATNNEIAESITVVLTIEHNLVDTDYAGALISDIKSKLQQLFDDSQSEEE